MNKQIVLFPNSGSLGIYGVKSNILEQIRTQYRFDFSEYKELTNMFFRGTIPYTVSTKFIEFWVGSCFNLIYDGQYYINGSNSLLITTAKYRNLHNSIDGCISTPFPFQNEVTFYNITTGRSGHSCSFNFIDYHHVKHPRDILTALSSLAITKIRQKHYNLVLDDRVEFELLNAEHPNGYEHILTLNGVTIYHEGKFIVNSIPLSDFTDAGVPLRG